MTMEATCPAQPGHSPAPASTAGLDADRLAPSPPAPNSTPSRAQLQAPPSWKVRRSTRSRAGRQPAPGAAARPTGGALTQPRAQALLPMHQALQSHKQAQARRQGKQPGTTLLGVSRSLHGINEGPQERTRNSATQVPL